MRCRILLTAALFAFADNAGAASAGHKKLKTEKHHARPRVPLVSVIEPLQAPRVSPVDLSVPQRLPDREMPQDKAQATPSR
jgi:hypothetical protein